MKYILILISFIALSAKAQTWTVITNLEYKDGRINAYNSLGKQIHQVNCKDMVYVDRQNGEINIYDYKNENNNLILTNKLVSPTLASVRDSLNAWIASCNSTEKIDSLINVSNGILTATKKLDTTSIDTSLIQHIQLQQIIDSLSVLINDSTYSLILNNIYSQILRLDTTQIDTSLIDYFEEWNRNNDTLSAILHELKLADSVFVLNRDTAIVKVIGLKDTLYTYDLDTSVVYAIDSTYYTQLDSIISILNSTTDSIYTLQISNGIKQLDGTVDSFNCRSVSFAWRTMATGTATITGSDGTSLIFNPLDELPNWSVSDGNKLGKIYIDATGATGLRIFYTGCENPCFKKIQAIDCTSGQPIQLGDFNDDFNDDFLN